MVVEEECGEGVLLRVTDSRPKGSRLRPRKGINFPDTELRSTPLTPKDLEDLDVIGELADAVGYRRLAELQEEILWLCEAAHVPVIWATQVLDRFVRKGIGARAEITDAAMAERAECVMLNKGPFVVEAVELLTDMLSSMEGHQFKKVSRMRALHSW